MDNKFTELIKDWLELPRDQRDYTVGALYLLKLSGNQIMYRNLTGSLTPQKQEFIEYQLQKYYNFRVQNLTHSQVQSMSQKVEEIVKEHIPLAAEADTQQKGKRADHDQLPDNIKACYVENLSLLQRMRELHLKLRSLSLDNVTCPDSERYPFLKELITLDKKLHANWEQYDHYVPEAATAKKIEEMKRTTAISDILKPLSTTESQAYLSNAVQVADILEWVLQQVGTAEIWQTSFSISEEFLRRLYFICKANKVSRINLVLDHKATNKTLKLWAFITQVIERTYLADNHSKILLVKSEAGDTVSVVTSQNLTRGNRAESAFISTSPEIFAQLYDQVNDLITNHSVPLNELFNRRISAD